ncbi:MAG: hypothetical protein U1E67_04710 [Hyphomicrobiales bacterium]
MAPRNTDFGVQMAFRVDIDFIGLGHAGAAYGGYLRAWSFFEIEGRTWFEAFRADALSALGKRYLPIYRMADGEYRFLMGRRFNRARHPIWKELASIAAERLWINHPDRWRTSWGEGYSPKETRRLRGELIEHIRYLALHGYLACYINDNAMHAFTEYNTLLPAFLRRQGVSFNAKSYVPFHFAPSLFISPGWEDFIRGRKILVVTGLNPEKEQRIRETLGRMSATAVEMLPISSTSSMMERLDISAVARQPDVCLVAAGIGAANILRQLEPLSTLAVDIGGLMNCFADCNARQHGGVIGLPSNPGLCRAL